MQLPPLRLPEGRHYHCIEKLILRRAMDHSQLVSALRGL
jgi:hypothetical protein